MPLHHLDGPLLHRVVKKKKTSVRPATREPTFNETLNFELSRLKQWRFGSSSESA